MGNSRQSRLSWSFWSLNVSQFLGAMNDNIFRIVMMLALIARASDIVGPQEESPLYISGIVFSVPFILFSAGSGILADRFSKRRLIVLFKLLEVVVMALGLMAFLADSPFLIYLALFLMAAQSTLFGPCKFGILPEMAPPERISYANGLMQMFSYLAIIFGIVLAAPIYGRICSPEKIPYASTFSCWKAGVICTSVAALGFLVSFWVKETGVRTAQKTGSPFFWKAFGHYIRACRGNKYLILTLFAIGFFLFLGGYVQLNVTPYGMNELGMEKEDTTYLFLALAFGIGIGSYLAGRISGRTVEIGLVPIGSLIFSAALISFIFPIHSIWLVVVILFLMGLGGGFYNVPLNAYLQQDAPEEDRGELIAATYFLSFCGMAAAAGLLWLLNLLKIEPGMRFFILGLGTVFLTGYTVWVLPDFLIRFLGLMATRICYRLEIVGGENIPLRGGALLAANHVSYIDAALLIATQQRRIRFIMYRQYYENRRWKWLFRLMGAIPISSDDNPKEIIRSLQTARKAVDEGWLVCLFAEGTLTRTGNVMEFKRGLERIAKGSSNPIIPIHLHGIWGSRFTYGVRENLSGAFGRLRRHRVTITFGSPMPSDSTAFQVRQAVLELGSEAFEREKRHYRPLPIEFALTARSNRGKYCMSDTLGRKLTYGRTLTGALALTEALRSELTGQECVGILMPTSVGGALANLAVSFLGKIPVNLNYTASRDAVDSSIRQCRIKKIITSRKFLEKIEFPDLPGQLFIEDIAGRIGAGLKIRSLIRSYLCPTALLIRTDSGTKYPGIDDTAAIIFSSGSTGEPKGIELTHAGVTANIRGVGQVFRLTSKDVLCGVLPFFHSFGFTGGLWLPIVTGIGVAYHPNPIDAQRVGDLVEKERCTMIFSTPTFLTAYIRKVSPEKFSTLRYVIVGAEKLKSRTAAAFQERFGILPLEGYGATELSPVASVNVPNASIGGTAQEGVRLGSIGRPIPGVTMRIVDPNDLEREMAPGEDGLLLVRGPNVMKGYLDQPQKTADVMHKGWYVTGDIARIDPDGFVTITDRLSRFSKIGGEMVPHLAVEEALHQGSSAESQVFAVASAPDEKKGERLVVLHTSEAGDPKEACRRLRDLGLPNLWIPSPADFYLIDSIPILGSGKVDLKALKSLARKHTEESIGR